jgi:hypothetical protein
MDTQHFSSERINQEDRSYDGSTFAEVRDAIFANPYPRSRGGGDEAPLPVYRVTLMNVLRGLLPLGRPYFFRQASERAVDSHADLRWGADRKGFRRLLHPNGVCLTGLWEITERTGYSGYFRKDSRGLVIGRYSTCCSETRRGQVRSLSLVGKLFPTTDPDHSERVRTASFITQQDIGGDYTDYINDAQLLNAPNVTAWRRAGGLPILMVAGRVFRRVDKEPTSRQLYQIAELGKPAGEATRTPAFMRLSVAPEQPRIHGAELDFRDEILGQIFDENDRTPRRTLKFLIDVTDEGTTRGVPAFRRRVFHDWRRIGSITFDNAVASYNGDFVVHFNHPTWRDDRDDPSTATRVNGRKVRWV